MRRVCIPLLCLFVASIAVAAETVEGRWEGAISLPSMKLEVEVDLARSGELWQGDISIPVQQARDLPLTAISVEGARVAFRIQGVPGEPTFAGTVEGAVLRGTFTQGGQSFPFSLDRKEARNPVTAFASIDELVASALPAWDVPGLAVAVVEDGRVAWAKGFGLRDVDEKLPMTADTLLPIGSVTKSFTTTALGTLVDEGRLAWDEPVRTYLPWFRAKDEALTAGLTTRDMVTHRSGLPRHDLVWYNNQTLTRRQLAERIAHLEPSAGLRERWQYNNLMFLTAGVLLEELTGKSWEAAVRDRILAPLGMTRTTFRDEDSAKDPDHARPYREHQGRIEEIPFREVGNMGPAGSINSSVNEMARYALLHLEGGTHDGKRIVQPGTIREMHAPQMIVPRIPEFPDISPQSYGHGWFIDSYRAHRRVAHGGNIDGFSALLTLFPDDGIGIVAIANAGGTGLPGVITNHIADQLLGLDPRDWNGDALAKRAQSRTAAEEAGKRKTALRRPGAHLSHPLAEYAGEYEHPGYGLVRVEVADKTRLKASYNGIETWLEPWHFDVFNGLRNDADPTFEDMKYHFRDDVAGNIASVEAPFDPFVDPIVFRKLPDRKLSDPAHLAQYLGEYQLGPQTITVSLRGKKLVLNIAGQPPYLLAPAIDGWYDFEALTGFRARFTGDTVELSQPNGLFVAKRKG